MVGAGHVQPGVGHRVVERVEAVALVREPVEHADGLEHLAVLGPGRAGDAAEILFAIVNSTSMRAIFHGGSMSDVHRLADRFVDSIAADLTV